MSLPSKTMKRMCRPKQNPTHRYGLRVEPGVGQGFPSAWSLSPPRQGQGQGPHCWCRSPGGADSIHSGCVLFLHATTPHPRGEQCWSNRGWRGYSSRVITQATTVWSPSEIWLSLMGDPCNRPWSWQSSPWSWSVCLTQAGPGTCLVSGSSQIIHLVLTYPFCLASGASKCSHSPQAEFRHPLGHQITKGACLPFVRPQSPICGSNSSFTRQGLHWCNLPFPPSSIPKCGSWYCFSALPVWFCMDHSYSFGCTGVFLLISS